MEPLVLLGILIGLYLFIYLIAQILGPERLNKYGIEASIPFFVILKTKRLNAFLTKIGKKIPRRVFDFGIVVSFFGMIFGFWIFTENFIKFFTIPAEAGGVIPLIPGITITGLPIIYMIIGLAITLLTHEFAHGLASSREDIPIKSSGLLFFLPLFGGFVEPDEEVFEKEATPKSRMRVLAAGSYANLIFALLTLILLLNFSIIMSIGFNPPSGAYIYDIDPTSPASESLELGDIIIAINDTQINTWNDVSSFMAQTRAGENITIQTLKNGAVNITLAPHEVNKTRGYIGIYGTDYWEPKPGWEWIPGGPLFAFHLQLSLTWNFIILFSVALFNLMPIPMLDGDKLLINGLNLFMNDKKKINLIVWPLRIIALVVILLSIVLSLWFGKGIF